MMSVFKISNLFGTCFGIGFFPWVPGTCASLFSIFPWYLMSKLFSWNVLFIILILIIGFGFYFCNEVDKSLGVYDHKCIVLDEFIGMWCVLIFSPDITNDNWLLICIGFFVFRVVDICKPWPISVFDRKIQGGIGIVFDDIIAAMFSIILIFFSKNYLLLYFFKF